MRSAKHLTLKPILGPAINLSKDLPYTTAVPADSNYSDSGNELTNSQRASNIYTDTNWVGYQPNGNWTITLDLGTTYAIAAVDINLLYSGDVGIFLPNLFMVESSDDNTTWSVLTSNEYLSQTNTSIHNETWSWTAAIDGIIGSDVTVTGGVAARYVRITLGKNGAWIFSDDITVTGWTDTSQAMSQPAVRAIAGWRLNTPAISAHASDMMLVYNQGSYTWTAAFLEPYLVYTNRSNGLKDSMFPAFLFLAIMNADGTRRFVEDASGRGPANVTDWLWYLDRTFKSGGDMDALNQSAQQAAAILNKPGYTEVAITIPLPHISQTAFGTLPGGGSSLNFSIGADQQLAVNWYVDQVKSRFAAGNYTNLQFVGFYWMHETIYDQRHQDTVRVAAAQIHANDPVHGYENNQLKFYWIPWYMAQGIYSWRQNGFDVVAMQPNYIFGGLGDTGRCTKAASLSMEFNLGTELELDNNILTMNDVDKANEYLGYYKTYLQALLDSGNTGSGYFRAHYQDMYVFNYAVNNSDNTGLAAYDLTYELIKGTLSQADLM